MPPSLGQKFSSLLPMVPLTTALKQKERSNGLETLIGIVI
ncbi:hypothetical protein JCM19240_4820 [Vibrio maritimus]|uniref:Uncharacterized protein n=1 Tax=Vibrio maritimus TaxID=990268 RepID=A0A090T7D2_9VIBR|nr:hypothetical protein JCM19240_4820 [Vibrio maritimus]